MLSLCIFKIDLTYLSISGLLQEANIENEFLAFFSLHSVSLSKGKQPLVWCHTPRAPLEPTLSSQQSMFKRLSMVRSDLPCDRGRGKERHRRKKHCGRRCTRVESCLQFLHTAVIKPPMAKIANVFGRLEAFTISVFLYILGYIQMAGSQNVETFASAQIFYSAGFTGLLILQQIFIADTSDLTWRALLSSLPDVPFLVTVWLGPLIAQRLYTNWR
jgi:hypothetical protein